jgi:uncharacterized LabA/DUF88 family protein
MQIIRDGNKMKIGIFIDGSTLYYGLKSRKFDFRTFRDWLLQNDELTTGMYFNSFNNIESKKSFLGHVYMSGFKLYIRDPIYNQTEDKLNISISDVEFATEVMSKMDEFDKAIIVSGKYSYLPLCEKLTLNSKAVEVVGFKNSVNKNLRKYPIRYVDDFLNIVGDDI